MRFETRHENDVVVMTLHGDLEGGEDSSSFISAVDALLAEGRRKFVLNLDRVGHINSSGIGIIASAHARIAAAGGVMKLSNANKKVSRVMLVTRLLEAFESYEVEEQALAAFHSG